MKIFSKRIYYAWHRGSTSGRHRFESRRSLFFLFFVYYCNCLNCWSAARIIALLKRISKNEWLQTLCVLTTWLERSVSWRPNLSPFFLSFFFLFPFALASPVRDQSGVSDWAKGQSIEVAGSLSASGAKSNHYAVYVNKETTRTFDSSFYVLYVTRVYSKRKMTPSRVNFLGKQDKVNTETLSFESETCEILFKDTWCVFVCLFF